MLAGAVYRERRDDAMPALLKVAAAALAYRDAPDGTDDCFDAWVVLETALSKVRP